MKKLKILVVDDDATTCSLLETALQMENYQTASVNRVKKGDIISLLNRETPHILILDFHLGTEETLKYVTFIRANDDWEHLPILITSAIDRRQDCLAAGADGFILKPFNWQGMTESVNEIRNRFNQ
jgi:DNA-binding response OmpR family regulator